jgi:phage I-like protein
MTPLIAACDRSLPEGGKAPEWVHILPQGRNEARAGRVFLLENPATLLAAFEAGGVDLPVDYEHQNDRPEAKLKGPVPVAGWIKSLRADASGVWGRVEWTATAAAMIARREYRYLSPAFLFDPNTRRVLRLKGAGLVHGPALHLTALAATEDAREVGAPQGEDMTQPDLAARLTALPDMPEGADEEALLTRVADLVAASRLAAAHAEPDPRLYVPAAAVADMVAQRNAERAQAQRERIAAKVEAALAAGVFLPALKGWASDLAMADEAAFDTYIAKAGTPFAYLRQSFDYMGAPPPRAILPRAESDVAATVCKQLGLAADRLNG